MGEPGQQVLTGLKAGRLLAEGTLAIASDEGVRTLRLDALAERNGHRYQLTPTGPTTFTVRVAGAANPNLTFPSVPLPDGTLPLVRSDHGGRS